MRHAIAEHPGIAGAGRDHVVDGAGVGAGIALGLAGVAYTAAAAVLGVGFLELARRGVMGRVEGAWARRTMLYSIAWLTALMLALVAFAR